MVVLRNPHFVYCPLMFLCRWLFGHAEKCCYTSGSKLAIRVLFIFSTFSSSRARRGLCDRPVAQHHSVSSLDVLPEEIRGPGNQSQRAKPGQNVNVNVNVVVASLTLHSDYIPNASSLVRKPLRGFFI